MGLSVLAAVTAQAGPPLATRSQISVTAQVAGVTRIEGMQQPAVVTIGRDDVARGYVTALAILKVRSNAAGYVLTLWPRTSWFESVRVDGAGTTAEMPQDGGAIVRRTEGSGVDELSLELTFRLRDGIADGAYSWPVEFEVSPL